MITAASHIVKQGGTILLAAACQEGLGSPEFTAFVRRFPDSRMCLETMAKEPVVIDQWQLEETRTGNAKSPRLVLHARHSCRGSSLFMGISV